MYREQGVQILEAKYRVYFEELCPSTCPPIYQLRRPQTQGEKETPIIKPIKIYTHQNIKSPLSPLSDLLSATPLSR